MNLAIKGHATRGKEVIEVLEMLGGKVTWIQNYCSVSHCYFINSAGEIDSFKIEDVYYTERYKLFTLKEYLESFPYKVGDNVVWYDNEIFEIIEMYWNPALNTVTYGLSNGTRKELAVVNELEPYRETKPMNIKPNQKENKRAFIDVENAEYNDVEVIELLCLDKFEVEKDGDKLVLTRIKPQYPKTYEECCKVLFPNSIELGKVLTSGYNCELLKKLGELLISRDAYWKIAGGEMGINGSWRPNLKDGEHEKYIIYVSAYNVELSYAYADNHILAFPTEEMRDAFYENFKELIEACKELLQ